MSADSVPSARKPFDYQVLHVTPAQRCRICARKTHVVIVDTAFVGIEPVCPLHGYAQSSNTDESTEELQMRYESVKRYALWMHADMGRIVLVSPVTDLGSIPGYELEPLTDFQEVAFFVTHEDENGVRQDMHVVWSELDHQFYLYRDGALVEKRAIEQVA